MKISGIGLTFDEMAHERLFPELCIKSTVDRTQHNHRAIDAPVIYDLLNGCPYETEAVYRTDLDFLPLSTADPCKVHTNGSGTF